MIRWEYTTLFVSMQNNDHVVVTANQQPLDVRNNPQAPWDVLNAMGAEGWEFIAAVPTSPTVLVKRGKNEVAQGTWIFYLKRPILT